MAEYVGYLHELCELAFTVDAFVNVWVWWLVPALVLTLAGLVNELRH